MVPPLTLCAYMKKGPNLRWSLIQCSGGDEGDRTPDLLTASQALSQLSYAPVWYLKIITQVVTNFKPFFVFLLIFFRKAKNIAVYSML